MLEKKIAGCERWPSAFTMQPHPLHRYSRYRSRTWATGHNGEAASSIGEIGTQPTIPGTLDCIRDDAAPFRAHHQRAIEHVEAGNFLIGPDDVILDVP